MRILAAFLYVVLHYIRVMLGGWLIGLQLERFRQRRPLGPVAAWLLSTIIILVVFSQYSLLVNSFPMAFVSFLLFVTLFLQALVYVFRALRGLDSPAKERRIDFLNLLWGAVAPKPVSIIIVGFGICFLLWPIAVLWVYFSTHATQLEKEIQISIYHFCIPAIVAQVVTCIGRWHLLTSHHVDDDLRNVNFVTLLTISINVFILVLYPAYLLGSHGTLTLRSSGIWLLLSVPVLILFFGVLLPFITGHFRYKAQLNDQIRWLRDWTFQMSGNLQLTPTGVTKNEHDNLVSSLEERIRTKFDENRLFRYLQQLLGTESEEDGHRRQPALITDARDPAGVGVNEGKADSGLAVADADADGDSRILQDIERARKAITHVNPFAPAQPAQQQSILREIFREEGRNLVEWDASYSHISELLDLRQSIENNNRDDVIKYLQHENVKLHNENKDLDALKRKNFIAEVFLKTIAGVIAAIFVGMIMKFEPELIGFMGKIIHLG